jgi:hypothetical protein
VSIAYLSDPDNYVATKVFPQMPVQKKSDLYWIYNREAFYRSEMQRRAPGAESVGSGYNMTRGSYNCDVWALHRDIDDQSRANADAPLNLDRDATVWLTQQGLIRLDQQWASNFFSTGVWTGGLQAGGNSGDLAGGTDFVKWSAANSTPIEDIRKQIVHLSLAGVNKRDMVLVLGAGVWQILADHPEIINRLKITEEKVLDEQLLAALWGIRSVQVAWSVVNVANEGGTPNYQYIMGNNALLAYINPAPGLMQPTAGYTFFWQGYMGGSGISEIQKFRIQERKSDRVEIEMAFDPQVVAPDLGCFFSAAV